MGCITMFALMVMGVMVKLHVLCKGLEGKATIIAAFSLYHRFLADSF